MWSSSRWSGRARGNHTCPTRGRWDHHQRGGGASDAERGEVAFADRELAASQGRRGPQRLGKAKKRLLPWSLRRDPGLAVGPGRLMSDV